MRPSTWSRRPLRAKLAHRSRALQLAIAKLESVSMGPTTFGELETSLFATSAVDTPRGSRAQDSLYLQSSSPPSARGRSRSPLASSTECAVAKTPRPTGSWDQSNGFRLRDFGPNRKFLGEVSKFPGKLGGPNCWEVLYSVLIYPNTLIPLNPYPLTPLYP